MTSQPSARMADRAQPAWDGLSLRVAPDRLVVGPAGAGFLARAVVIAGRVDGITYSHAQPGHAPVWRLLADLVATENRSTGQADVRTMAASALFVPMDEIGTEEAAQLLGCSREHANRLARDHRLGPTRKVGNRRLVSRAHVDAYITDRRVT